VGDGRGVAVALTVALAVEVAAVVAVAAGLAVAAAVGVDFSSSSPPQAARPTAAMTKTSRAKAVPAAMRWLAASYLILFPPVAQILERLWPPSTLMQAPVTQLARSETRKTTTLATSSAVPKRPMGMFCRTNWAMPSGSSC
jgi:hypothetical protein